MWGWILAAVLWVLGTPFFWSAIGADKDRDRRLRWKVLALVTWPFIGLFATWAAGWQKLFPPKRPEPRGYPDLPRGMP